MIQGCFYSLFVMYLNSETMKIIVDWWIIVYLTVNLTVRILLRKNKEIPLMILEFRP